MVRSAKVNSCKSFKVELKQVTELAWRSLRVTQVTLQEQLKLKHGVKQGVEEMLDVVTRIMSGKQGVTITLMVGKIYAECYNLKSFTNKSV